MHTLRWVRRAAVAAGLLLVTTASVHAQANCEGLPTAADLFNSMNTVGDETIGGLFAGERFWAAVVNRDGQLCSFVTSTTDRSLVWPGSQAIAKAKAYTANAFSNDLLPLSTARLYTFVQPDHSLYGLNQSNPFDPDALAPLSGDGGGLNRIAGGMITFGGGLALYEGSTVIGGLGLSGDTACADHEMAKRVRDNLGLNPPGGALVDDIVYNLDPNSLHVFKHPTCVNTWRNGANLNRTERPAPGPNELDRGF